MNDTINAPRLVLFTGHFGSGKTEIAVNYALRSADSGHKTILVDLDIVNPFFRSSEVGAHLEANGVKLISPNFVSTAVDVPSLPAEIYSVFSDKSAKVIFDVGGDEIGARVLGQFHPYFQKEPYLMYYVINTKRPLSCTEQDILSMMQEVQRMSRLRITHLINNTNLSYETEICDIINGHVLISQISKSAEIPIAYIAGVKELLDQLPDEMDCGLFPIRIFMKPPWR
ncbi:MAG: hypothetical protein ACOYEH_08870 [Caldicoprobacterales bacterium]|jgi:hypothetical protein|nr:hypothetical protein [Clostridiales bacterium]